MVFGDLQGSPSLKKAAAKFVSQNMEAIDTYKWEKIVVLFPTLFDVVKEMKMYHFKHNSQ